MDSIKDKIEEFIDDWYWDKKSKKYAFELGKFLFAFLEYINDLNLSKKVIKRHKDNVYFLGRFDTQYNLNDEFDYEDLTDGPHYIEVFERKVSDSIYAVQSYTSTWNKLDKFINSGDYEKYVVRIEQELNNNKII